MTTPIRFHFVDVFADEPLTGSPLALVPDAEGLSDGQMRAIAQEFNLSETTFLLPPTDTAADWRLRSFTPGGVEVGGAGHNAMGAWLWLAIAGRLPTGVPEFTQQIGDSVLPVRVRHEGGRVLVSMDQAPPQFGGYAADSGALAAALGIGAADLAPGQPAQVVSTGAGHLLVRVRDRDVVDRVRPVAGALLDVLRDAAGEGCYVYCLDPLDPASGSVAYARFFNPTVGIAEDPATGTAAGPLVAALVARGTLPDGVEAVVEQGFAIGRPSRLRVNVNGRQVRLSGSGLVVADGTLYL